MLAGGSGIPPDADAYLFEPKLDGQRVVAIVEPAGITLTNRRGGEITATYPELAGLPEALAPHAAVLDGEVVAFNEKGHTSFQRLQRRMHVARPNARVLAETPVLVAEIAYSEITEAGTVRQPSVKGLRTDAVAREVVFDEDLQARFADR